MSLQEAVNNIRGPRGTPVILSLYREGRGEFEVTVTRDTITIPSVELEIGEWQSDNWTESPTGTVAWLKVLNFGELTGDQWETAVNKILQNNQIKGVVLDVRNNGGGFFQVAIDLASEFVPQGTVVVQQKDRAKVETYSTQRSGSLVDVPLVVLVNKGTASASEILAGALRDKAGAKIVGVQSFGKGTVQDALELRGDTGLHITIAEWLLPNGDSIQEVGLTPDIEVPIDLNQSEAETTEETAVIDVQLKTAVQQLINL
jgi:carboxyl-terminal processing protease